jgi:predicted O-methyltransferase YrrM
VPKVRHPKRQKLIGPSRRRFDYDRRLLPNAHIAALEEGLTTVDDAVGTSDSSVGYPAWNLLYYTLYTSILPESEDVVVIETGTNRGISSIVMAQALEDLGVSAVVDTVEIDPAMVSMARENVESAGLTHRVRFHNGDAIEFLSEMADRHDHFDFVMCDDDHTYDWVMEEMKIVCPKVAARAGKVYFDNAAWGDVLTAVIDLRKIYGGNLVHFDNCSYFPPGAVIWQPDLVVAGSDRPVPGAKPSVAS